ncbi:MAG: histidine kinase, partial [Verrucomicrobiaceae bacterium]
MELEPFDLTIEPDGSMGDYPAYERFLARQSRLARIQNSPRLTLTSSDDREFTIIPDKLGRPFRTFPPDFWVQLAVGLTAWLVSAAVHAFRPQDAAARYLLLSGAATLLFSPAAAVYTTRELSVDGTLFRWASDSNFFGGSLFAASFVALLLHYPRRLAPAWVGLSVTGIYVVWFLLQQFGAFESMTFARRFLVMVGVGLTFILAGIHWIKTGKDPVARAALQWFLLSWMLGTSLFASFILLPQLFGLDTSALQGYSFLLFLLVYGGLAFGILRYRLFELGDWWRRIAGWTLAVIILVALDMLFLFGVGLSSTTSLTISLAVCGLVWLPFRAWIWGRLFKKQNRHHGELFWRAMDVALAPKRDEQTARWKGLLASVFDPLEMTTESGSSASVAIRNSGLSMTIPPVGRIPAMSLKFAKGGASLFSPHDAALAGEMIQMLTHTMESRSAYENGVNEERSRIARDIHDNIGAQLLAALHSDNPESKDSRIRETLSDLRDVINNIAACDPDIDGILADLRMETSERLAEVGISLK